MSDLRPVESVPEILLWQEKPGTGLWQHGYRSDTPPPFHAFAWPGGRVLARYLLDNPETVAAQRVLDVGAGSGLVAIAAARAGAASVVAVDSAADAVAAIERNAAANAVPVTARLADLTEIAPDTDVIVAGDLFYSKQTGDRARAWLRRAHATGVRVYVGDAGRGFLPTTVLHPVTSATLPVARALEGVPTLTASVWTA